MHRVEPQVFLIGETHADYEGLQAYLEHIGAPEWHSDAPASGLEEIIEVQGRGCYRSFGTELNANLTRVREGNERYLSNILRSGHGSVLEHGWACFQFCDVSRVLTHELVRHRTGTALSQESLRFVRADDLGLWIPSCFAADDVARTIFQEAWHSAESRYRVLLAAAAYKETGESTMDAFNALPFPVKKKYTSAARRVLPEGMATNIGWSCNLRALRHVIEERTAPHAEEEIRLLFGKVATLAVERWPALFQDYQVEDADGLPWYKTEHVKV